MTALILVAFGAGDVDADKEPLWEYKAYETLYTTSISDNGKQIVVGSETGIYLFDNEVSTPIWKSSEGSQTHIIGISDDGENIVSQGNALQVFRKDNSTPLWSFSTSSGNSQTLVSIDSAGEYIVTGGTGSIRVFKSDNSTPLWQYNNSRNSQFTSVAISSDGNYIIAGSEDTFVYFFDRQNSAPLWTYETDSKVSSVAISEDGNYLVAGSQDENVYFFEKDSSVPVWTHSGIGNVHSVDISDDGSYIVASIHTSTYVFGKNSNTPLWNFKSDVWQGWEATPSISGDGKFVVFQHIGQIGGGKQGVFLSLYEIEGKNHFWSYENDDATEYWISVSISYDGNYISAVSYDNRAYLFEKGEDMEESSVKDDDESSLPSVSMIPALISIGLIAIYRRK